MFIRFHEQNFAYDPLIIWDLNHQCLYASKIYLEYIGTSDMKGKYLSDISEEYQLLSTEFREKVTTKVLDTKKPHLCFFLLANRSSDDFGMHQIQIFPLFDKTNQLIAYCSRSFQLLNEIATTQIISSVSSTEINKTRIDHTTITEREKIVIFLLTIGLSHKEIAQLLSRIYEKKISISSVSNMISRQIYLKFDTNVNSILIQKAVFSGLFYNIPRRLVENLSRIIFVEDYILFTKQHGL